MANQYLQQSADDISSNMTRNWTNNVLPSINSGAMMAGGFGGSRQGIAQSNSIRGLNDSIGQAQTSLYGNAYEGDQNRQNQMGIASMQNATNRYGIDANTALGNKTADNNYNLGLGNLGLGYKTADNNYSLGMGRLGLDSRVADYNNYNTNRGMDISSMGLGMNMVNGGNDGLANGGKGLYGAGSTAFNAPGDALKTWGNLLGPFTGLNGSTNTTTPGGSALGGALGGGITLAQLYQILQNGGH